MQEFLKGSPCTSKLHRLGCFLLLGAKPHFPPAVLAPVTVREEPLPSPVYCEVTRLPAVQEAIKQPRVAGDLRKLVQLGSRDVVKGCHKLRSHTQAPFKTLASCRTSEGEVSRLAPCCCLSWEMDGNALQPSKDARREASGQDEEKEDLRIRGLGSAC